MFHYIISKLSLGRSSQTQQSNRSSNGDEVSDEDGRRSDSSNDCQQYVPTPSTSTQAPRLVSREFDISLGNESKTQQISLTTKDSDREVVKWTGYITRLDESMPKGVIDRTYFFDIPTFCVGNHQFANHCQVDYEAFRSKLTTSWTVTSLKLHASPEEQKAEGTQRHETVVARVVGIEHDYIRVEWGDKVEEIPNIPELLPPYPLKLGDWVKIQFELYDETGLNQTDLNYDETLGQIISVEFNRQKTVVGKMTRRLNELCVDDEIHVTQDICKDGRNIPLNALVKCVAVDSTQEVGIGRGRTEFQWRAVDISLSHFMQNTADKPKDGDGCREATQVNIRYQDLYDNRGGVKIEPEHCVKFQAAKIGTSVSKPITVHNLSARTIVFHELTFPQDASICRYQLELPQREEHDIRTLGPDEFYTFQVICTPLHMGRTKEMGVFDFKDFKIARDFVITGLTQEEDVLDTFRTPYDTNSHQMVYKAIRESASIDSLIEGNKRTRIRGNAPVRSAFFKPKRTPRYLVPDPIWKSFKDQDESIIKCAFPGALKTLDYTNYLEKFHVSLWFEEVENDIRRREQDMFNVQLRLSGKHYMFNVQGIQDFSPPLLSGDAIDVFDPEPQEEANLKYQGYIRKIIGSEIYVDFNEMFHAMYKGEPLTVRFCLSRMSYKKQHYAVEMAVQNLGESFLFPFGFVDPIICRSHIQLLEDDRDEQTDEFPINQTPVVKEESTPFHLFNKPPPPVMNKKSKDRSAANIRAQSMRTPFVSDALTVELLNDVKLTWYNHTLNEEQRNAVKRILRGQVRPLPYIIYGPPGTGKTVTIVEAIMQVNKLDPISRVLVAAPSNHAADIITEQLVKSGQYQPGEFVRLNGFMRQEQVVIETIKEYCVDGEELEIVAKNRLVVSTCGTAGQFFNLNLTPGHFTHVFLDEAGYCTEPETMIPAVNLDFEKGGQLILAGDPNQLGPVLMSDVAQNLALNLSFLERLMKGKAGAPNVYSRDTARFGDENGGYNPLVLTKLVRNYRAHPSLLKLPSSLFYNGDLISCALHDEEFALLQDPLVREHVLLAQGVPIIFHGVQGTSIRERDSPSWFNTAEVMEVIGYIRKLKICGLVNEDIGIITPYRKQAEKLRLAMTMGYLQDETPKVGSVEEFQGGERKVVIISTVRSLYEDRIESNVNKLGFIFNEKRFNVAITRAKSLMIIVGNPYVLYKDTRWNELLRYCIELQAYTGCNLPAELDEVKNKLYKEFKDKEGKLLPTLPPDMSTATYNADGLDYDEFETDCD